MDSLQASLDSLEKKSLVARTVDDYQQPLRLISQRYAAGGRRDVIECITAAKGVQDSFAQLNLDVTPYSYLSGGVDDTLIRSFCSSIPIPFHAFNGIRRSKGKVELNPAQRENAYKAFDKLREKEPKDADISASLPFVSVFFYQRCPDLHHNEETPPAEGATFLLLSVITGDKELCQRCLALGANPNNMSFLREENMIGSDMCHGYSPMFMAVLAEQIEILDLLKANGGTIHVYDRWGRTPLHAAVAMNSVEVVQWLLANGAPRYLGDCLNILPAESAEEDYFPELAMPNPALTGFPPKPSLSYFLELVDESKAAENALNGERAKLDPCHCHSGRPKGYCGCVDDMYYRWSLDRLNSQWSAGVRFYELAQRSTKIARFERLE